MHLNWLVCVSRQHFIGGTGAIALEIKSDILVSQAFEYGRQASGHFGIAALFCRSSWPNSSRTSCS